VVLEVLLLAFLGTSSDEPPPRSDSVWPDYRGPRADGVALDADLPLEWGEDRNVRWKTEVHGRGWSSPVVHASEAWMTTATPEGHELSVVCVDLEDGAVLHDLLLLEVEEPEFRNALNSYASPSPVIEEGRVYVHFGTYGTACLDTESGETLWERKDLHCSHLMGPGSSPVLGGDLLFLQLDGADVQYVAALDKRTGETVWKKDRSTDFTGVVPDMQKAYGTPLLAEAGGRPQLLSSGAQASFGYAPDTGEELWTVRHKGFSMSARPLFGGGLVVFNTGFGKARLVAVRLGGEGDVTDSHVAWEYSKNVPTMASGVLVDDLVFMVDDGGIATCLELETGARLWRERIGGQYSASPLYAKGRLYFFDREGTSVVLKAGRKFEVLASNELDSGFMASPAVVGDAMLLRTKTHLYRVEAPKAGEGG